MDNNTIGKTIHKLRKLNNMTQQQLADNIYVTDKAVSKWETGTSIPDLQQLESLTKLFNVKYDELINGDLSRLFEEIKIKDQKNAKQAVKRRRIDSTEWFSLDNAAKVYPSQATRKWNMVFRMSAVLKENVDINVMQKALNDMVQRFPTFMVTLKKGVFWNYFDYVDKMPKIVSGFKHPCEPVRIDGKNYLFRVVVDQKRVAIDFFHSLTDGNGALVFIMTLVTRYYELLYGDVKDYKGALNIQDKPRPEEIEDSFGVYGGKGEYAKRIPVKAYHVKGKRLIKNRVTHVILDATKLHTLAKSYNATITEFVTAILAQELLKRKKQDKSKNKVIIQVPINLRKKFPSESLRNFAFFASVEYDNPNDNFEQLIEKTKSGIKKDASIKVLQSVLNANLRDERNLGIRIAPLIFKEISLLIVNKVLGDRALTLAFSNLGRINAPDELSEIVDRFEFVLKDPKQAGYNFSAITYNNKCVLTFNTSVKNSTLERDIIRVLSNYGLELYVESNGGIKDEKM